MHIGVLHTVVLHNGRLVAGIVEEMQGIIATGQMHDIFAMQGVVGRHAIHCLLYTQAILVVLKLNVLLTIMHTGKLAALLPGICPGTVVLGVANRIVDDSLVTHLRQLILPIGVSIRECGGFIRLSLYVLRLAQDIAALVVGVLPGRAFLLIIHPNELPQRVVDTANRPPGVIPSGP